MDRIRAGIIGATGYAGTELCRILLGHPGAEIVSVSSRSFQGQRFSSVYPAFRGILDLICEDEDETVKKSDVIFAAVPSGLSEKIAEICINLGKVFIDLGADFRLESEEEYRAWYDGEYANRGLHEMAVYGLPELFREKILKAKLIANPGCYATAVPLALAPALIDGLVERDGIIADCKSGVTGAGRTPTQANHYPELNESFTAYKVAKHRHTPEIEQTLGKLTGTSVKLTFVPHLLPVNRGILATCYARLRPGVSLGDLYAAYEEMYGGETFIRLLPQGEVPNIKYVRATNFCDISLFADTHTKTFIAISALDNLCKGAAGQAVQNMNLAFGIEETAGLTLLPEAI